MMKSFLQTTEWMEFQRSLGRKVWLFDNGKIKATVIRHDLPFGMNYLYIPHGPEIDFNAISGTISNEIAQFVTYLQNIARGEKSIFVKLEPLDDKVSEFLHQFKFKKSAKEIQAHKSVILDLGKPEEELMARMHHKTRYNIKVSEKHGITTKPSFDVDAFWKLLRKTKERQKFSTHPKEYYKKLFDFYNKEGQDRADILFATYQDKPIAGALYLTHGDTCYYLHGGSDYKYRNLMAPYALHWNAIKYLNTKGIRYYDFGGSETSKWPGVTRFKLSWGGRQVEYPGAFDLSIRWFWFFVYKILRKIF